MQTINLKRGISSMEINTQEMLENAVYQQLFLGGKRIMGKNPENTMQLTGVDEILTKFIGDLDKSLPLLSHFKVHEFISHFAQLFSVDLSATENRIQTNFEGMGGIDQLKGQETIVYYMVMTKLLESLRETAYKQWGFERIKNSYEKQTHRKFSNEIHHKIQNLAALNESNISLLYNLCFILLLTTAYEKNKFSTTLKRLTSVRINKIIDKIAQ